MADVLPRLAANIGKHIMTTILLGSLLFLIALTYQVDALRRLDMQGFEMIHHTLHEYLGPRPFQELWFLGKTPLALLVLLFLIATQARKGLIALIVFIFAVLLERALKLWFGRRRPFQDRSRVHMTQPIRPSDPSFPSGDSLRVWFLAYLFLHLMPEIWLISVSLILLAFFVTLGRIVMGVHYPADTLAGAGMGLLAGKLTVLIWQNPSLFQGTFF